MGFMRSLSFRRSHSMRMEKFKRTFSFRKKKDHVPECSKPHQWQEDEKKVREGTCSFQVRYLGCIEVFESRGMQVCEEAVKALKQQCKGKYQRAILYVSGDALRVVDEISKGLIVDQTIEKVSFCAPDRSHEKGFAYICRDGTTRRWMCHGFLALKESVSGERLSHAVGCAFAICLERKQKRDKESGVTVTYSEDRTSFARTGSFRQTSMTERLADPQSAIVAEPVPVKKMELPYAVERPHATANMLQRMGSFRGFSKLNESSSPFKRQLSLRLNELPSTIQRQQAFDGPMDSVTNGPASPIAEASPTKENQDSISDMCMQLTQGLSALTTTEDPFASVPRQQNINNSHHQMTPPPVSTGPVLQPLTQNNPWGSPQRLAKTTTGTTNQGGDFWLKHQAGDGTAINGNVTVHQTHPNTQAFAPRQQPFIHLKPGLAQPGSGYPARGPPLSQTRSHSIDTGEIFNTRQQQMQHQRAPTLRELTSQGSANTARNWQSLTSPQGPNPDDPFDVAWAAKATNTTNGQNNNTFNNTNSVKAFEVQL